MDKRNKMIDNTKMVYVCIKCNYKYIGTLQDKQNQCPACKHSDTFVIQGDLIVTK